MASEVKGEGKNVGQFDKSNRLLAKAFEEQSNDLLQEFFDLAEHAGHRGEGAIAYLDRVGHWERLVLMDHISGGDIYLSDEERAFISEVWKLGTIWGGASNIEGDRLQQFTDWSTANATDRSIGFGIHILMRPLYGAGSESESVYFFRLAVEVYGRLCMPGTEEISKKVISSLATAAANALHDAPGGSREKKRTIREIWASGKYSSRDVCAEQECAALEMSFSTARKALRGTPDPS